MHFQTIPVLAAIAAFSGIVSAKVKCYDGGSSPWRDDNPEARSAAAHGIDKWCNNIAPSTFKGGQEVKQCLEVDYWIPNVMLRMKNGKSGNEVLSIQKCKDLLKDIVDTCEAGGQDDDSNGWRPRADPGFGCD